MGSEVACPHCSSAFFATPYQPTPDASEATAEEPPSAPKTNQTESGVPAKIPFFKFNRRHILAKRLDELTEDGVLDAADSAELEKMASHLKLSVADLSEIRKKRALDEFDQIRKRIEKSMWLTDADDEAFAKIGRKYDLNIRRDGFADIYRSIYLLEAKHQLPDPVKVKIPLKSGESCYFKLDTVWHQPRVQTKGYSGASVSIPSGIKGVRFRVGSATPIRAEEITPLSEGTVYVTNSKIIFVGTSRSTTIPYGKIVGSEPFSDSVKLEKATGRPDYFSMNAAQSRFVVGLLSLLGASGDVNE